MQTTSDPELAARLRFALARSARRLRQEAGTGLSPSLTAALATVERSGPLTPSELADAERVRRPTVTRMLGHLEDDGLISRTPDPADGRSTLVAVTPAGAERARRGAHAQGRLPLGAARRPLPRGPRDAGARGRDPRGHPRVIERTFSSLHVANYRRYFVGQVVSVSGNWMQIVAEMWLIVQLTGSGAAVGITAGLQFLPLLLFGAWGGVLADRLDKRRLLLVTQALMALPAIALWGLTASGSVETWMVFALVFARGTVLAFDNPARQSFVSEIVGSDRVVNAVALNSVLVHSSRIAGPAAAGALIALVGVSACFAVNAATFVVMIVALRLMDPRALHRPERTPRAPGQLRAAFSYVWNTPSLRVPLAMMVLVGTVSFNFQVLLPLLASETWDGDATTYALLTAVMGAGSVLGALGDRRARDRRPGSARHLRGAVRRRRAARGARADAWRHGARADPARRRERDLRRGRELLAAARVRRRRCAAA